MSRKQQSSPASRRTPAEWVSLSASLLLLAGVVGVIVWLWVHEPAGPPQFKVERGVVRNEAGLFHLHVAVTNVGGSAAGQVRMEGSLSVGGQEERPVTTIEFLPVRAREEVILIFRSEPSGANVEVVSFQLP
jgi:uncharacterized protein (TIGR02588 family)